MAAPGSFDFEGDIEALGEQGRMQNKAESTAGNRAQRHKPVAQCPQIGFLGLT
jgi:hypothetical protein